MRALTVSDKHMNEIILIHMTSLHIMFAFLAIFISYLLIFTNILMMYSGEGYQKTFSTCVSHLTAVFTFLETITIMYIKQRSNHSMNTDKYVFYTMIIHMLDPVVCSLDPEEQGS